MSPSSSPHPRASLTAQPDTVFVRGLEFEASHGVTDAEQALRRRFRVDLELSADLSRSAVTDDLADTIDYWWLSQVIVEKGQERPHRLLESVADSMVRAIQDRYPSSRVSLTLEKLAPPCPGTPRATAVRLVRSPRG